MKVPRRRFYFLKIIAVCRYSNLPIGCDHLKSRNKFQNSCLLISTFKQKNHDWYLEDLETLLNLLAEKKIQPVIYTIMNLSEAKEAHNLLDNRAVNGKIVILPGIFMHYRLVLNFWPEDNLYNLQLYRSRSRQSSSRKKMP